MRKSIPVLLAAALCLALFVLPVRASFSDVSPGDWYEGAVSQLTQAGALKGYPDGDRKSVV